MRGSCGGSFRLYIAAITLVLVLMPFACLSSWVVAQTQPMISVTILADGQERSVRVPQSAVRIALRFAGIALGPKDEILPSGLKQVQEGTRIEVVRVTEKVIRMSESLPFKTKFRPSSSLRGNGSMVLKPGKPGQIDKFYLVTYRNGEESGRKLTAKRISVKPMDQVVMIRAAGALPSRGYFTGRKVLVMHATGYDPGPRSCGPHATGRTAIGLRAGYGVVAVDPRYIPLGTRLYIEGYGYAVAADTGGAIKGNRIDLGHDTYNAACQVGRRMVRVHILD